MEKSQLIVLKGKGNETLEIRYKPHLKTRVILELTKHDGEKTDVIVDGAIFSVLVAVLQRVLLKWDGVILVTGDVGDGKSTIAQLICSIWEWFFKRKQSVDNIVFRSENFTDLIDKEDNETECILWDEAIQGGTGRDTLTKQGQALKRAFVTKRYKRHLYLLLVDEIQEYNKKIISRCRAWIHVETEGLRRGYFKIYDDKTQIKRMYRKIKQYNLELEEVIKTESPAFYGYQEDTTGLFFNEKEYQKKKASETSKEEENGSDKIKELEEKIKLNKIKYEKEKKEDILRAYESGLKQQQIAKIFNMSQPSVSRIIAGI